MKDPFEIVQALIKNTDPVEEYEKKYAQMIVAKPEAGSIEEMILQEEVKEYVLRKRNMMANVNKIFAIIWGQCTDSLQSAIRLHPEYEDKSSAFDGVWLMGRIEENIAGLSVRKNNCVQLREKLLQFLLTRQYKGEKPHEYMVRFKTNVRALKMVGGNLVLCHEVVMKKEYATIYDPDTDPKDRENDIKIGSKAYEAVCLLMGSNHEFGNLKKSLAHSINVGRDEYPKTIQGAYELLMHTLAEDQRRDRRYTGRGRGSGGRGSRNVQVSFA